jgi:peptide deformylase
MQMNLVLEDNPVLKQNVSANDIDWNFIRAHLKSLLNIMDANSGMGLASTQLGISQPFFVTNGKFLPNCICYPKILHVSEQTQLQIEQCLSFPGLKLRVLRPIEVVVEFQDIEQQTHQRTLGGLAARLFQHETDHLNGICFVDRVAKLSLKMALERRKKNARA